MDMLFFSKPLIIAHRGASGYEPENTLRAFQRALEMGASMVELDVFQCASGEIMVMHDDTINRTTNGTGYIKQLTYDDLKKFDAGKGEHIPLLSQVFDLIDKRALINIELKDRDVIKPVANLIKYHMEKKSWSSDFFIVSSFDPVFLQEFHNYCPSIKTGIIVEYNHQDIFEIAKQTHSSYLIVPSHTVTEELLVDARVHGLQVFTYTVNTVSEAQRLAKLGVDGIITDYPDILV
ncbi:MAG: glycerophosphodiester phosphodiesterase [Candidatus Dependentiae bacterium]|nr:glycerophosphodiester phosphodiesterase [Candidatus Dependentiae bacterium]